MTTIRPTAAQALASHPTARSTEDGATFIAGVRAICGDSSSFGMESLGAMAAEAQFKVAA